MAPNDGRAAFSNKEMEVGMAFKIAILLGCLLILAGPSVTADDLCGATIAEDLKLHHDLTCAGAGLIVGADGITIDLNGHTITGLGKGEAKPQPCNNWGGTGVLKGTKGTITFKMLAGTQGCGDEEGNFFSIVGRAVVTKATGTLAKARGNLKVTGSFDRAAGTFTAKFTGKLKK